MDNLIRSNIRQRPIRTLVSVAGVALGVTLVMLFTGLTRGMSNDMQRRASNLRAEIIFTRPGSMQLTSSTSNLSTKYVDLLKKIDGVGFEVESSPNLDDTHASKHYGLTGMHERASLIGAQVDIDAKPGQGTRIQVIWESKESI